MYDILLITSKNYENNLYNIITSKTYENNFYNIYLNSYFRKQ